MTKTERDRVADLAAALRAITKRLDQSIPELGGPVDDLFGIADELDLLAVNMRVTHPKEK